MINIKLHNADKYLQAAIQDIERNENIDGSYYISNFSFHDQAPSGIKLPLRVTKESKMYIEITLCCPHPDADWNRSLIYRLYYIVDKNQVLQFLGDRDTIDNKLRAVTNRLAWWKDYKHKEIEQWTREKQQ